MDFRAFNYIFPSGQTPLSHTGAVCSLCTGEKAGREIIRQPLNFGDILMKKAIALVLVGLMAASCTQTEKGAGIGAVSGAIIGGAVTGNVRGAAVGAAIGGVAGGVIGHVADQPGQCYYRDRYGRRYIDAC
jgi:phage tail tape-measure protein